MSRNASILALNDCVVFIPGWTVPLIVIHSSLAVPWSSCSRPLSSFCYVVYPSLVLAWLNSYINLRNSSSEPPLKIGSWVLNVEFDMLYFTSRKEGFGFSFGGINGIASLSMP